VASDLDPLIMPGAKTVPDGPEAVLDALSNQTTPIPRCMPVTGGLGQPGPLSQQRVPGRDRGTGPRGAVRCAQPAGTSVPGDLARQCAVALDRVARHWPGGSHRASRQLAGYGTGT
jgi:hypothetical protein